MGFKSKMKVSPIPEKHRATKITIFACLIIFLFGLYQINRLIRLTGIMPIYNPIDELYHYDYILKLAEGEPRRSDAPIHPQIISSVVQYGYRSIFYYGNYYVKESDYKADLSQLINNNQINQHPPLYYWIMSFFVSKKQTPQTQIQNVRLLRRIGVFLFLAGGVLWALGLSRILGYSKINILVLIMIWAWTPTDLFRVSNDMGVFFIGGLTFYVYTLLNAASGKREWLYSILLGISLALCAWTKYNLIYLLLPCVCVGRFWQIVRPHLSNWKKAFHKAATEPAFLICAASIIILKMLEKMEMLRLENFHPSSRFYVFSYLYKTLLFGENIWQGRRLAEDVPSYLLIILLALIVGGILSALLVRVKRAFPTPGAHPSAAPYLLACSFWMLFIQGFLTSLYPWFFQGRYLIPLLPFLVGVMAEGYSNLSRRYPIPFRKLPILMTLIWVVGNCSQIHRTILIISE